MRAWSTLGIEGETRPEGRAQTKDGDKKKKMDEEMGRGVVSLSLQKFVEKPNLKPFIMMCT